MEVQVVHRNDQQNLNFRVPSRQLGGARLRVISSKMTLARAGRAAITPQWKRPSPGHGKRAHRAGLSGPTTGKAAAGPVQTGKAWPRHLAARARAGEGIALSVPEKDKYLQEI